MITFQFIKSLGEIFLITLSVIAISILGSQHVLEKHFNNLSDTMSQVNNQHAGIDREIKQINIELKNIYDVQKEYYSWTPKVLEIAEAFPEGIILNSLTMDRGAKIYTLSGLAVDRQDLLVLQENLEKNQFIKSIDLPPAQLTQKKNIVFTINVELN